MTSSKDLRLLVTSGDGPRECRRAVALILGQMRKEAARQKLTFDETLSDPDTQDPPSAIVRLSGEAAEAVAKRWVGTVQWIAQSPFRPHHKRRNWFVGVFRVSAEDAVSTDLDPKELKFETFRAGGPGGQHQNTTDSAVRLTHLPTGIAVISRDERSQHRNKQAALRRLADRLYLQREIADARSKASENILHKRLERGNAVLCFKGEKFVES